jgi:hypothetical protein
MDGVRRCRETAARVQIAEGGMPRGGRVSALQPRGVRPAVCEPCGE